MPFFTVTQTNTPAIKNAPIEGLYEGNGSFNNLHLAALVLGIPWLVKRTLPVVCYGGFKTYLFLVILLVVLLVVILLLLILLLLAVVLVKLALGRLDGLAACRNHSAFRACGGMGGSMGINDSAVLVVLDATRERPWALRRRECAARGDVALLVVRVLF